MFGTLALWLAEESAIPVSPVLESLDILWDESTCFFIAPMPLILLAPRSQLP